MKAETAFDSIAREFAKPETRAALDPLSLEQRGALHAYWVDRARGELTTALTFEFMLDDLRIENAPRELLELASSAIRDEHRHVDWCLRWARLLEPETPEQAELDGTRPLEFDDASAHDNRLLRTVFGCCFSETVAVHVLKASHASITEPTVRRLNQQHLREEVGHSRLGWALLGWQGLGASDRSMLRRFVPEMTALVRRVWQSQHRPADPALHALGYLSSEIIDPATDDALANVIEPGLVRLGV